tara:strand:+ start:5634 stop:7271 length:1638 start_codon:yes stop_codon:yes gene_type:complete
MPKLNGAQAIVEGLLAHGVDTVFGIPGIQLDPLFDALHGCRDRIRTVHTRHEQGAAFMAMGYAQVTGRPGVFAAVPGPGMLNAMAAVSTAVAAGQPVLCITGQIPSYQIGEELGIAHELRDQLAVSRGVVSWSERADHPRQVPELLEDAFRAMTQGRPGPAILEMAPDRLSFTEQVVVRESPSGESTPEPNSALIKRAVKKLCAARNPVIVIGGGGIAAGGPLKQLAEKLSIPVISTISARGVLSDDHPLSFTFLTGQHIWERVDVALVVGTRFTAPALAWGRQQDVEIIRIDIEEAAIRRPVLADIELVTSADKGLQAIADSTPARDLDRASYLDFCNQAAQAVADKLSTLQPLPALAGALRAVLPEDGVVVADVTQLGSYVRYALPAYQPRTIMGPGFQATLGYALPAALGVKLADPARRVVAVCGDGGFMFTLQELATAVHHNIAVVIVILDNASFGNVKTIQAASYGARHIAVDLTNPDFVALGESFGIRSCRVESAELFGVELTQALAADAPRLIVVPIGTVPSIWDLIRRPPSQGVAAH